MPADHELRTTPRERMLIRLQRCANELHTVLNDPQRPLSIDDEIAFRRAMSVCDRKVAELTTKGDGLDG